MAVARGCRLHPGLEIERVRLGLHAAPRLVEVFRRDLQHAGLLHHHRLVGDDVAPGLPDAVDVGHLDLADAIARALQMIGGLAKRRADRRIDRHVFRDLGQRDLDRALRLRPGQRRRHPPGIARIALAHHLQRKTDVADVAGERPLRRHQMRQHRPLGGGASVEGWDAPLRRLDGGNAIAMRRPAQRAADVVAMRDGADAGGDRRTRAARGAAAGDVRVPGIERQSVQRIVGEAAEREFRRVGEAENDRAGLLQVTHHGRIRRRDEVLVGGNAVEIGPAFVVDVLLDGDGHAVQQAEFAALGALLVGRMRGLQRVLAEIDDDRIQPGIDRMHPLQMRLDGFHRGDCAGADRSRGLHCRPLPGRPLGAACGGRFARRGLLDRLLGRLRGGTLAGDGLLARGLRYFLRSAFLLGRRLLRHVASPEIAARRLRTAMRPVQRRFCMAHWRDRRCDGLSSAPQTGGGFSRAKPSWRR